MRWTGRPTAAAAAVILLGASYTQARAEDSPDGWTVFGWTVSAHLSAEVAPDYIGAKTYSVGPVGSLSFHRPGAQPAFGAPDDGIGLQLLGDRTLAAGLVVRARSSRDSDKDLQGVHKVDFALEPGLYAQWWPSDFLRFRAEARHGVMGNFAWSGDLAADLVHDDGKWLLSVGPRLHLGDSDFLRTYFDVSAIDAARSPFGIGPFASHAAYVSPGVLASAEYRWSPRWSLVGKLGYDRLLGDAADSPIVARLGSPDQFRGALGFRYRFGG